MLLEPSRLVEVKLQVADATSLAWVRIWLCMLTGGVAAWLGCLAQRRRKTPRWGAATRTDGGPPPVDWQWQPVECKQCPCRRASANVRCDVGLACVNDRHPPRIERFFAQNPDLVNDWLGHPYSEVRASASRRANLFRLAALLCDPDENVRMVVALRVPQGFLNRMLRDPHPGVRLRVAERVAQRSLVAMLDDPEPRVRRIVARRGSAQVCERLRHDPDWSVSAIATERLERQAVLRKG